MAYLDRHDKASAPGDHDAEPGDHDRVSGDGAIGGEHRPEAGGAGARERRAELEGLVDQIQPGWRNELVTARFQRRLVVAHALPTAATGGLAGRPPVAVTDRAGVFLAGDWVGATGHLADAVIASAAQAADAALLGTRAMGTRAAPTHTPTLVGP
jgi:hypothetical protein